MEKSRTATKSRSGLATHQKGPPLAALVRQPVAGVARGPPVALQRDRRLAPERGRLAADEQLAHVRDEDERRGEVPVRTVLEDELAVDLEDLDGHRLRAVEGHDPSRGDHHRVVRRIQGPADDVLAELVRAPVGGESGSTDIRELLLITVFKGF